MENYFWQAGQLCLCLARVVGSVKISLCCKNKYRISQEGGGNGLTNTY